MKKLKVLDYEISTKNIDNENYVSLTDLAKYKGKESFIIINNWIRNTSTIEFLGLW
jgi:KilA-N domain.